jgi:hypothetical protein
MKRQFRILSLILLFFNSVSAVAGGIMLISDPTGKSYEMPLSFLEHSPFNSFLVPGIILLTMNGMLSLAFAFLIIRNNRYSAWLVIIQGCVLFGWLLTQLFMIREFSWLYHPLYLGVAAAMVVVGGLWYSKLPTRAARPNSI